MIKESRADRVFNFVNIFALSFYLMIVLYPLLYILSASISDPIWVNNGKMWLIPRGGTFDGYRRVFQDTRIWIGYGNTVFYTIAGTAINLIVTFTCAYPLSRKDFTGRKLLMIFFVITMFFNGGLIPTFLVVRSLGMYDTFWAMLIPGAVSMFNVIITRTYIQSNIPLELQEAAFMDGCSNFRLLGTIVLPLSLPVIAVNVLFYGVAHWNEYFTALIYISDKNLQPLQIILREILVQNQMSDSMMSTGGSMESFATQGRISDSIKYAVMIVATLPILCVYPFLQKYFVHGIMLGAIKG